MADLWNTGWNTGWNIGWNEGYNAAKSGRPSSAPTPQLVPTPTPYQAEGDPWNVGWNVGWNTGWNEGYNKYLSEVSGARQSGTVKGAMTGPTQTTTGGAVNLPQAPTGETNINTPTGPGAEEIMRQQLRGQVESIYQPVFESLDRLAGLLPGWKEEKLGTIGNLYQTQLGELGGAQEAARQRLEGYRGEIRADQAQNLKALAESMRNWARAGQIQLGSWGAGSSSATPMYQYALAKEAGKRGTDIARQSSAMFNDLRMKEEDINLAYNQSKSQLDTWKTEQMGAINDWYNTQLSNIEQQKATASGEKARALASAENSLIQEAYNRLLNIQGQAQQWDAAMKEWAINRLAGIDDMKMSLGQMANYSPQQIVWNELQGMGSMPQQSYEAWNPYARKAREEEERFAGTWR